MKKFFDKVSEKAKHRALKIRMKGWEQLSAKTCLIFVAISMIIAFPWFYNNTKPTYLTKVEIEQCEKIARAMWYDGGLQNLQEYHDMGIKISIYKNSIQFSYLVPGKDSTDDFKESMVITYNNDDSIETFNKPSVAFSVLVIITAEILVILLSLLFIVCILNPIASYILKKLTY